MPKIKQSIETSVINDQGDLVSKRANKTLAWGDEPAFIKFYLQDVLYLSDMPKKHSKVLYELLKRATYAGDEDGMQVCLSAGLKRMMMKSLGCKNIQTIDNALCDLTKGKVLYRIETGVYQFNPYLFGKGDWQDINRLRLEIDYNDIKGKTFKTVCEYKPKLANEGQQLKGQMSFDDKGKLHESA